jgi:Rps23 Pro-64 3,4-dihydroxylase Tpa1-like proline 4-hydroxylase
LNKTKPQHIVRVPNFFSKARLLRKEFENRFENPKLTTQDRFVWDYWYVKDQYRLIRTMAENIFSEKLFLQFQKALVEYGKTHLGCDSITPPWVSYYVDGCSQQFHADVPHGPWAYVFSLTPWQKKYFEGGETILLKPETLNYWRHFEQRNGVEMPQLTQKIPALFNQLLVFDPRIPHGVSEVRGVQDPLKARLVIHGWFTHPRPVIQGALASKKTQGFINELIYSMEPIFSEFPDLSGSLTIKFAISPRGRVQKVSLLTNTLLSVTGDDFQQIYGLISNHIKNTVFPSGKGKTAVTIPFLFQAN